MEFVENGILHLLEKYEWALTLAGNELLPHILFSLFKKTVKDQSIPELDYVAFGLNFFLKKNCFCV
jgi:hypothetical protein